MRKEVEVDKMPHTRHHVDARSRSYGTKAMLWNHTMLCNAVLWPWHCSCRYKSITDTDTDTVTHAQERGTRTIYETPFALKIRHIAACPARAAQCSAE